MGSLLWQESQVGPIIERLLSQVLTEHLPTQALQIHRQIPLDNVLLPRLQDNEENPGGSLSVSALRHWWLHTITNVYGFPRCWPFLFVQSFMGARVWAVQRKTSLTWIIRAKMLEIERILSVNVGNTCLLVPPCWGNHVWTFPHYRFISRIC